MHKLLLAAVAIGGLTALTTAGAVAAPSMAGLHVAPQEALVTDVDYWHGHHHWHHRHWARGHWHYWD
jgi:hypothetical protein